MSATITSNVLKAFAVDHLNIGVFSVDKDMNVLLWNGFMENHSHKMSFEVVGCGLFSLFPSLPQTWLRKKIKSVFILKNFAFSSWRQRPYLFKFNHNRPITSGIDYMRQDIIFMPIKGPLGQVEAVNITITDVTDISISQGMMAQTMEQMETLERIVKTINQQTELDCLLTTVLEQGLLLFPQIDNGICWLLDSQEQFHCTTIVNSPIFAAEPKNTEFIERLTGSQASFSISMAQMTELYSHRAQRPQKGIYHLNQFTAPNETLADLTCQQSSIAVTLVYNEKIIGFLAFNNYSDKSAFDHFDLQKLVRFREHTISAIAKAKDLKAIAEHNDRVKHLLNNAGQGFLSFGSDLKVADEYSAECKEIFDRDISADYFPELIFAHNQEQQIFVGNILSDIFAAAKNRALYMPLLPAETTIGQSIINIQYRPIKSTTDKALKMLVILTDITQTRALENKVEQERNRLRMIVSAATKPNEVSKLIKQYQQFCHHHVGEILNSPAELDDIIFELFRQVHTFKGEFSQLEFVHVTGSIHQFETQLGDIRQHKVIDKSDLETLCLNTPMWQWLEQDIRLIEQALGENFLNQEDMLTIASSQIRAIEINMLNTLSPIENQIFLPQLKRLKAKPLASLLEEYGEYISRLAESLDKALEPMTISGDEIYVDPGEFGDFCRSLIHVFRNIIDHGIETIEDRIELGKSECGVVCCHITRHPHSLLLHISDDGSGIDVDVLRRQLIKRQRYDQTQAQQLSTQQVINSIFERRVTVKQQVSDLSGRGIGLHAVKHNVDRLGGTIKVISEPGGGTSFYFDLPLRQTLDLPALDSKLITSAVIKQSIDYLTTENNRINIIQPNPGIEISDKLRLKDLTTFIRLKGMIEGVVLFSFDRAIAQLMADTMLICDIDDNTDMLPETMTEICNIILGNSLQHFPQVNELVMMDVPITLNTRVSVLENFSMDIVGAQVATDKGNINICFIRS